MTTKLRYDAKQFAELTHCQCRSENKLHFHHINYLKIVSFTLKFVIEILVSRMHEVLVLMPLEIPILLVYEALFQT